MTILGTHRMFILVKISEDNVDGVRKKNWRNEEDDIVDVWRNKPWKYLKDIEYII